MVIIGRYGFILFLFPAALLLAATTQAANPGFKCVDGNGRVEYRELALDHMTCTSLRPVAKPSVDPQQVMEDLRERVSSNDAAPTGEAAKRKQNCERARANVDILEGDRDVVQTNADGEKVVLAGAQRNTALEQSRKDMDYWCN